MENIRYDVIDTLIFYLNQNKSIGEISYLLNYDKCFIFDILKILRTRIVEETIEDKFYLLPKLDKYFIKSKIKINSNYFCDGVRTKIFNLVKEGKSACESISILGYSPMKYNHLIKTIYAMLCSYAPSELKVFIPNVKLILNESNKLIDAIVDRDMVNVSNINEQVICTYDKKTEYLDIDFHKKKEISVLNNYKFIVISDTHYGSIYENLHYLDEVYNYAIKENISDIYHCGDFIDGNYNDYCRTKNNMCTVKSQAEYVVDRYLYDKNITNHILLGNHDFSGIVFEKCDITTILNQRSDFDILGYKIAYIKLKNEFISLKHAINKIKNNISEELVLLNFSGHTHQYRCNYFGNIHNFKVPALCDLKEYNHCLNKGYLVCEICFDNDFASYIKVKYISFDKVKNDAVFERILK